MTWWIRSRSSVLSLVLLLGPAIGYDAVIPVQLLGQAADDQGRPLYDVTMASLDGGR